MGRTVGMNNTTLIEALSLTVAELGQAVHDSGRMLHLLTVQGHRPHRDAVSKLAHRLREAADRLVEE